MSKILELNKHEIERERNLVLGNPTNGWQDLKIYFQTLHPANDPGSAGCVGDYMYENNGDYPPSEPWVEDWLSDDALKKIWDYFTQRNGDILDYVRYAGLNLYEFANVYSLDDHCTGMYYKNMKPASRRLVPMDVKKKLAKFVHSYHIRGKVMYYFRSYYDYAVKHPKTGYLITENGSIITQNNVIMYAL